MRLNILSFSAGAHDCAFSMLQNGYPLLVNELERFNRVKECSGQYYNIFEFYNNNKAGLPIPDLVSAFESKWLGGIEKLWPCEFNIEKIPHHTAHSAHGFFSSSFDEALIFSIDGGGDENGQESAFCVFRGNNNKIEPLVVYPMRSLNIGNVWNVISKKLSPNGIGNQAGSVMAMAGIGEVKEPIVEIIIRSFQNEYFLNKINQFNNVFDIAASLQFATEQVVFGIVNDFVDKTGINNLCFTGGVALNSSMLGKLANIKNFNIYVPPIPYDSGLTLGSAQYIWHHRLNNPRIQWKNFFSPYLGNSYDVNIEGAKTTDSKVIDLLESGKIVAVYGGRTECGRRALGNRSILANPMRKDMKDLINKKVKHRQSFRPFAPSILSEDKDLYFENSQDSPYMSLCLKFKSNKKDEVPAVVHIDGTGRLQTVDKESNPWFHNLLSLWKCKTGCSVLLNTSFNDREPIVETPDDALRCFKNTNIDYLYFRDKEILIKK